jgi:death on curing protein
LAVEPLWVPIDVVITANAREVARSNPPEPHQILDIGKLEGAVERPRTVWGYGTTDLIELAVTLFEGIAHAHGFLQGNKRTAWKTSIIFLKANGLTVSSNLDSENFGHFLTQFVAGDISKSSVIESVRRGSIPYTPAPSKY